ncbi:flagellar biosynthetic protein FliQ [Anaerotignum neopropionicum]|uniref:Flagellar biosynthetic protein FliQ n=1 Tax=Anaerotignum neopropionicum TaxID=36847 RepID=A0A136WJM8_9FIRM|nr:flagellar biosynthesis protein FliQ [Anaerotignum neopropionicum]KXL54549.1 flagellar biosynthetic protein FliQ [Anaerotignum neopropionicum]
MTNGEAIDIMRSAIIVVMKIGGPILLLSMAIGVFISIIQAATQIHEQTITFVPKVIIIVIVCLVFGPWMLETLQDFMYEVFNLMI